jgi:hypothetical protein
VLSANALHVIWPAVKLRKASPTNPSSINNRFKAGVASVVSFSNVDVVCYETNAKTPKKLGIDERRFLVLKKDEMKIFKRRSLKMATFTLSRWAQFIDFFHEIDQSVAKLVDGQQEVKLQLHVGAGRCVIVTSGYCCVDIRKFCSVTCVGIRPTESGIALRLSEWSRVKEVAKLLNEKIPAVAEAQPCWTGSDHYNQEGAIVCGKCYPYGTWQFNV